MEAAVGLPVALLKNLGPSLFSLAQKKYNLYKRFQGDVIYLTNKLPYITAAIQELGQNGPLIQELSRLAHDIEDCIDHINYHMAWKEQGIWFNSGNRTSIEELDKEMDRLKMEVQRIIDALINKEMDRPVSNPLGTPHSQSSLDRLVLPEELFGMEVHMEELRLQLVEAESKQLKVISIVGFCGSGKTLLAHQLYESPDGKDFEERAWVSAGHRDSLELLREILTQLHKPPLDTFDVIQLSTDLRKHLNNKKYGCRKDLSVKRLAVCYVKRLNELLINDYTSLPTHDHKACLLYFAMFPSDHPIRTKRLMRQWFAEGLLKPSNSCSDPAAENFKILMDRNIIEPIDVSNNTDVKTCKTYGMMHEYITLKSHSENIIAMFGDRGLQPKRVRRLSICESSITDASNLQCNLSLVRSLIITGNMGNAILDLSKYKLLRVLDLEQCTNLQNENLKKLCNLLLLRYLSLGAGVTNLPKKIKQLKLLETLDLRRSAVRILRPEVVKLPNLVHLFGKKFVLREKVVLASRQCKLQTLAGFLVDKSKGFAELMSQMKKLQKVKIWCGSSATYANLTNLQYAIQNFIDDVNNSADDPRSMSVHFEGCSEDLLEGLHGSCYLASLKLQGRLLKLPRFVNELRGLTELCLQSSTKFTADLLIALCDLKYLRYLKLIAKEIDEITIKDKKLRALLRLCYVLECPKTFPKIEEGAMPNLESLQLLCKDMAGLSDIQIKGLKHLKEVILDNRVDSGTKSNWMMAANEHPNRPKILLLRRVDPHEGDPGEDPAAPEATENEIIECPVLPEELIQDNDTQMHTGKMNSATYKITGHPVVCAALTGLSISGNDPVSS